MGVKGLISLLRQEGWLPALYNETNCAVELWRNDYTLLCFSSIINDRMQQIPPHSELAIDGNGLAYYLYRVAYSRHFESVVKSNKRTTSSTVGAATHCSCPRKRELSEHQVTRLLPHFMPLYKLEEVCEEFMSALLNAQMQKITIYWDGDKRRMKQKCTNERKLVRDDEYSNLQQYCESGVLLLMGDSKRGRTSSTSLTLCQRDLLQNFPSLRLLLAQVRSTIASRKFATKITMVDCEEEADVEVAKACYNNPSAYIIGLDSDYCLFENVNYVPLDTLDVSSNTNRIVSGCVLTRRAIAEYLELPSEESMVELAILMGNDYINGSKQQLYGVPNTNNKNDLMTFLDHLKDQPADYRVTSSSPETQLQLDFIRTLYSFGDLSAFPLDDDNEEEGEMDTSRENPSVVDPNRPHLPDELDLSLAMLGPLDLSLVDVVLRPLVQYLDSSSGSERKLLSLEHLDAFRKVATALTSSADPAALLWHDDESSVSRPLWSDVLAAYIIDRTIGYVFRNNRSAPAVKLSSPAKLFDHGLFHGMLRKAREQTSGAKAVADAPQKSVDKPVERTQLPIDEHEDVILRAVKKQRVTIIHGETGCGKSSRVPVMLLRSPPPDKSLRGVKMFISQPRRIAAKSLVERVRSCEPDLKDAIALRMGHGVREYENSKTRAWFVTTGYLVRLLANHPEKFDDCSHLIIDEVHERSVDTDILCLLCRRLLDSNRSIRLILMSATMAAALYQQYFGVPQPPIHVGARRYPIEEFFIEDMIQKFRLPPADLKAANDIARDCNQRRCLGPPTNKYMDNLVRLAVRTTMLVGRAGSSVLIFVPGMNEIISIIDLIEKAYVPGLRYTCFPIHSDVPFDEQMSAFDSPDEDEVKVIIATNAAESSVTLPNVDHVVCLGLCKQIIYNPSSHRQMLMPAWISRASATQRAGRTGRVRPGNVYRLYTREAFEQYMDQFETGEMLRIPLDSVILMLKEMLNEAATPVFLQCLEPPNLTAIDRSFLSLCKSNFITSPNDDGEITTLGAFVSSLGVDLMLGSLIGLGIQFGVGAEAVELAAVLSFPKTPWAITSPLYHEAATYNELTAKTYVSKCHFDASLYSDPFAIMNLMWDYEVAEHKTGWAYHYCVSAPRMRRLLTTRNSLRNRVADFVGIHSDCLRVVAPPVSMPHAKLTLLRVIQVWVFSDTMIESIQATSTADGTLTLGLTGDAVDESHLTQVLDPERHLFQLKSNREITQNGQFTPVSSEITFDFNAFLPEFEARFISLVVDNEYTVTWYCSEKQISLFVREDITGWDAFERFRKSHLTKAQHELLLVSEHTGRNRRGRQERSCGRWVVNAVEPSAATDVICLRKWSSNDVKKLNRRLKHHAKELGDIKRCMSCTFTAPGKKDRRSIKFTIESRGECKEVSKVDLGDLFATPAISVTTYEKARSAQTVAFHAVEKSPLDAYNSTENDVIDADSSWRRPLLHDIPEGARLLSVLASGRRNEHTIHFPATSDQTAGRDEKKDEADLVRIALNRDQTRISRRWRQFASDRPVFVEENNVPASSVCANGPIEVFACCANTLDVRGGGLKVEGLTLLPPGRLFALLAFTTFGLHPYSSAKVSGGESNNESPGVERKRKLAEALRWLYQWDDLVVSLEMDPPRAPGDIDMEGRLKMALTFHEACVDLGEELVCHPELVGQLCRIFDKVDGYKGEVWDTLNHDPFTRENLRNGKFRGSNVVSSATKSPSQGQVTARSAKQSIASPYVETYRGAEPVSAVKDREPTAQHNYPSATKLTKLPDEVHGATARLFATKLDPGEALDHYELPSTNILCCLMEHYCNMKLKDAGLSSRERRRFKYEGMSVSSNYWKIFGTKHPGSGEQWYMAHFVNTLIPLVPLRKRKDPPPGWATADRPARPKQAFSCVPPQFSNTPYLGGRFIIDGNKKDPKRALFFESIETAVRMEAAFWLERQYGGKDTHWYMRSLEELMELAVA